MNIIDHLILGIADLDRGMAWIEEKTGVKAVPGGSHPGAGTRNALISLGDQQYLEIISLDPNQSLKNETTVLVQDLAVPRLIRWASATKDIAGKAMKAQAAGYEIIGPNPGSRVNPGGGTLNWKTLSIVNTLGGVVPFLIEWNPGIIHPSKSSPSGCKLQRFFLEHPESVTVQQVLMALSIKVGVVQGGKARLRALLDTPKGPVELS
jgi:hypothetical protein